MSTSGVLTFYLDYDYLRPLTHVILDFYLIYTYNINMNRLNFEWDPNKAKINIEKHNISFEEASTVFSDENAILFDDPDHSLDEERFLLLGVSSQAKMLIVCHCYRSHDEVIRIISARKATKSETKQYSEINKGW